MRADASTSCRRPAFRLDERRPPPLPPDPAQTDLCVHAPPNRPLDVPRRSGTRSWLRLCSVELAFGRGDPGERGSDEGRQGRAETRRLCDDRRGSRCRELREAAVLLLLVSRTEARHGRISSSARRPSCSDALPSSGLSAAAPPSVSQPALCTRSSRTRRLVPAASNKRRSASKGVLRERATAWRVVWREVWRRSPGAQRASRAKGEQVGNCLCVITGTEMARGEGEWVGGLIGRRREDPVSKVTRSGGGGRRGSRRSCAQLGQRRYARGCAFLASTNP